MTTGEILGDPLIPGFKPYLELVVDTLGAPLRGRVTPLPNNRIAPGQSRTLVFDWAGHGGELYVPFVSCNAGSFQVPGTNFVLPLAFDGCTQFYLTSPLSPLLFQLVPGGFQGLLSGPFGVALGSVQLPALTPPGLGFDLRIGFLTLTQQGAWTGAHGYTILHLSS